MSIMTAAIIAFLIVAAFLIGAYAMFRMSEHYNRIIRGVIEDREEERKVNDDLFSVSKPRRAKKAEEAQK